MWQGAEWCMRQSSRRLVVAGNMQCTHAHAWCPAAGVEELSVRLADARQSDGAVSGVAEVFHAGAWGTLCDGGAGATGQAFSEVRSMRSTQSMVSLGAHACLACMQVP